MTGHHSEMPDSGVPAPASIIDSPSNPRLRGALALRERRERDATGLTLVDGAREALRAVQAGVAIESAFVCRPLLASPDSSELLAELAGGPPITELSERAYGRLAYGDRSDGIVLIVRTPSTRLDDLELGANPLIVVTEDVEKPGNLGAILRSADATGASAVLAAGGTDLFNPNVIRASVGTVFTVPVAAAPATEVATWLRGIGVRIVASRVDAASLHVEANLTRPVAIVLGSEADGLSDVWRGPDIEGVRLPMIGAADSLNVSAAAAVLLYEAWRQAHAGASSARESSE